MLHAHAFPITDPFAAGKAAQGQGVPMSENPFPPGTLDHIHWIIGYQWGSDADSPPDQKRHGKAKPVRGRFYAWVQAWSSYVRARFRRPGSTR